MLLRTKVRTNVAEIAKSYCNGWDLPLLFILYAAQALFTISISVKKMAHLENLLQGSFAFRKFEANELPTIHKQVIFSRDQLPQNGRCKVTFKMGMNIYGNRHSIFTRLL